MSLFVFIYIQNDQHVILENANLKSWFLSYLTRRAQSTTATEDDLLLF